MLIFRHKELSKNISKLEMLKNAGKDNEEIEKTNGIIDNLEKESKKIGKTNCKYIKM